MSAEEMKVLNADENKAFYMAVSSGDVTKARPMLEKNPGLATINIQNGMLPIHMAASYGHRQMLGLLMSRSFEHLEWEQKVQLFFTTLKNSLYGNETHPFLFFSF